MPLAALRKLLTIYLACLYSQHAIPFTRCRGHLPNERHNSCHSILVIWLKPRENFMPFHAFQEWSAQLIARTFELYAQTKTKTMLWHTLTGNSFTRSTCKSYVIVRPVLLTLLRADRDQRMTGAFLTTALIAEMFRDGAVDGMLVGTLHTWLGEAVAFPPPVSPGSRRWLSCSFLGCIFSRFQHPCILFISRFIPLVFCELNLLRIASQAFALFFHFWKFSAQLCQQKFLFLAKIYCSRRMRIGSHIDPHI